MIKNEGKKLYILFQIYEGNFSSKIMKFHTDKYLNCAMNETKI